MNLVWFLVILCSALVGVRFLDGRRRAGRALALSEIARGARMNYSSVDRFDIGRRLQRSSAWTGGLHVRDILYGTRGEQRLFVATIERRPTPDERPRFFVIACAEPLDHSDLKTLAPPAAVSGQPATMDAYRAAIAALSS
jgi:hypothetical protein